MALSNTSRAVAALVWLICTVAGLWFLTDQRAIAFDPKAMLQGPNWPQLARAQLPQEHSKPTLYLLTDKGCKCNETSRPHQTKVKADAERYGIAVVQLDVTAHLRNLLPAVPAAILLDENQEVMYAGPLSVGLSCAISDGIIDTVIANYSKGFKGDLRVSDTRGCYCRLEQVTS
ncbi:DUF6436 domain-containing protein [Pseudoalteromonas sp. YIC-656]|uniref:DUF6436 domain-containing protein n=1 Tax=Pseudoalteromonas pernae TaxID=3118054 RepID=UPI003242659D